MAELKELGTLANSKITNENKKSVIKPGILPRDTIVFQRNDNSCLMIFKYRPPGPIKLSSMTPDGKIYSIKVTVYEFLIVFAHGRGIYLFHEHDGAIYVPGFKNINQSDCQLCIGNCPMPSIDKNPEGIRSDIISSIFDGIFTDDLNAIGISSAKVKKLSKMKDYVMKLDEYFNHMTLLKNESRETIINKFIMSYGK